MFVISIRATQYNVGVIFIRTDVFVDITAGCVPTCLYYNICESTPVPATDVPIPTQYRGDDVLHNAAVGIYPCRYGVYSYYNNTL